MTVQRPVAETALHRSSYPIRPERLKLPRLLFESPHMTLASTGGAAGTPFCAVRAYLTELHSVQLQPPPKHTAALSLFRLVAPFVEIAP